MKLKTFIVAGALALASAQITGLAFAKNVEKIQSFKKILAKVAIAERPAKVASLVVAALPADKKETMESLVEAVAQLNPTALPAVVGAISATSPELAVATSTFASTLAPQQADAVKLASTSSSVKASASTTTESIVLNAIVPRSSTGYNPQGTTVTEQETGTKNSTPGALTGNNYANP